MSISISVLVGIFVLLISCCSLPAVGQQVMGPPPGALPPPCVVQMAQPPCTVAEIGNCWGDVNPPASALDPIFKICTASGFVEIEKTTHDLATTFKNMVTIDVPGSLTNNAVTTLNGVTNISGNTTHTGTADFNNTVNLGQGSANRLQNIDTPTLNNDATRKDYVDTLAGGLIIDTANPNNFNFGDHILQSLKDPINLQDAATKAYVDNMIASSISVPQAFQPLNIPDLTLWLNADSLSNFFNDGDLVDTWFDDSGLKSNFSQSSNSFQPTFKENVINGHAIVSFDGANDLLESDSQLVQDFVMSSEYTLFVVFAANNIDTNGIEQGNDTIIGDDNGFGIRLRSVPEVYAHNFTDAHQTVASSIPVGQPLIVQSRHGSTSLSLQLNNNVELSVPSGNTESFTLGRTVMLGKGFGASFFDGDIAEVILYNSALDFNGVKKIRNYLNDKYAAF
ncbi:MAG: hypothetical protein HYR97_03320 [Candidatus Melainabacteria bacterium]|nr:hypothetical protein [Candidatus Melainabacteria bacterium]